MANGDSEEVTDHELAKFLKNVNPDMTTDDFIGGSLIYRLTVGETFTYKVALDSGVNAGKVMELHLLPSDKVDIVEGTILSPIRGYKIDDAYNIEFEKEDVVHKKMFNPLWLTDRNLHGQSPLKAAARIVSKQNQLEDTELKQAENQGPAHILFRKTNGNQQNNFTDPQIRQVEKDIKAQGQGKKRGLPYIAKNEMGKLDLGSTVADLNIIESSRDGRRILGNVYGFPMDLMNDPEGSTYNSKGVARKSAWTDCIMPNLKTIEETLDKALIEDVEAYKDLYFKFDYSEVEELQEGFGERVTWMRQAGWSKNEIRTQQVKSQLIMRS
jgi:HK97 family phage portal protein